MSQANEPVVLIERRPCSHGQGAVALLQIARPKALNAINQQVIDELDQRIAEIAADPEIRAVVLTGAGEKSFVAGADIAAMQHMSAAEAEGFARRGDEVMQRLHDLPVPVIAAVNGFCLGGGCELALACDFLLASTKARFGLPEVSLGVIPGFGGTQRLTRQIGRLAANRWILTGDLFSAQEAQRYGVVQELYEPEELLPQALAMAERIASRGPLAVAAVKRLIVRGADESQVAAIAMEAAEFGAIFATADQKEGMGAFLAKRPAQFTGA